MHTKMRSRGEMKKMLRNPLDEKCIQVYNHDKEIVFKYTWNAK